MGKAKHHFNMAFRREVKLSLTENYSCGKGTRRMLSKSPRGTRPNGRPRKYTREFLLSVPERLRDGDTIEQIAASVMGKSSTLLELCRRYKIALPARKRLRTFVRLKFSTVAKMQVKAASMGITYNELAEQLLDVIATDNMYQAVLDE